LAACPAQVGLNRMRTFVRDGAEGRPKAESIRSRIRRTIALPTSK
jgi:hypothetical protein